MVDHNAENLVYATDFTTSYSKDRMTIVVPTALLCIAVSIAIVLREAMLNFNQGGKVARYPKTSAIAGKRRTICDEEAKL